jgi:creatinine amidohydrolase
MADSIFSETMVEMPWTEIERSAKSGAIVLLPAGILEEHGPHMGLAVDICVSALICKLISHELQARGVGSLIAPPLYWGISPGTGIFPGTFSVKKETLKAITKDVLASLHGWGLDRVFLINWHVDYHHVVALLEAVKEARKESGISAYSLLTDSDAFRFKLTGKEEHILFYPAPRVPAPRSKYVDIHAGSLETGIMMKYFPGQVNAEIARKLKATELTYSDLKVLGSNDSAAIKKAIPGGYFGDPASYDTAIAEKFIETNVRDISDLISSFLKGTYQPPMIG